MKNTLKNAGQWGQWDKNKMGLKAPADPEGVVEPTDGWRILKVSKIAYLVFSIHFIFKMDIIMDKKKVES